MKTTSLLIGLLLLIGLNAGVESQEPIAISSDSLRVILRGTAGGPTIDAPRLALSRDSLRVILLGTAGGPTIDAQRLGISTLILAGPERLLFDCGRGLTTGFCQLRAKHGERA